jgi:hypothetical protein
MKTYRVEITEVLVKSVEIQAENEKEAYSKVEEMYGKSEIVLDYDNYFNTSIDVIEEL